MTTIDTTNYINGELRIARHGYGKGGNVFMHVPSGQQCNLSDGIADEVSRTLANPRNTITNSLDYFERVRGWHGFTTEPHLVRSKVA